MRMYLYTFGLKTISMKIPFDKDTPPSKTKDEGMKQSIGITTLYWHSRARQPFISRSQWCVSYEIFVVSLRSVLNESKIVFASCYLNR